ncbi:MAG: MFS transporter [Anaerolineales bacterium]|nr:MFS transporter [Anaerolineales bacterium]
MSQKEFWDTPLTYSMTKVFPFSFYFLYYAALAAMAPFLVLFYQKLGLSGTQIGILTGITPLISLFSGPFWAGVADATHRHRWVMSMAIGAAVATGLVFPTLRGIAVVALVMSLFTFFTSPIIPLGDSATIASLGVEKNKYGRVRLGGTIGWGLAAPVVGYLVEHFGLSMSFWSYAALMFLALLVCQKFTFPQHVEGVSLRRGIGQFARDRRWIMFLALAITAGLGLVTINNYLFAYMKELQISESVMGFGLTLSTLAELPVLFFANLMLKRFGAQRLLRASILLTALRILMFVVFNSTAGILAAQLLNGLNFPLFWAAGVSFADENAPAGMKSMAMGLFGSVTFGIGSALGGLTGGVLLDTVGSRGMFLVTAVVMVAGFAVLMLVDRWVKSGKKVEN